MIRIICLFIFCLSSLVGLSQTYIQPFASHNQSPLIHFFGLPNAESGKILGKNKIFISTVLNLASNSTVAFFPTEMVYFDGEMARIDIKARYGITSRFEIGINMPIINHSKGFLDSSIDGFHNYIGVSGGARATTPKGEILYSYVQDDQTFFKINEGFLGIGDINFEFGFSLLEHKTHAMALRAYLKMNNADKTKLLGSGSIDFSFQFSGQITSVGSKPIYFFYSVGYLRVGRGSLLENMQNRNIALGSVGLSVKVNKVFVPKIQFDYHSHFYKNTNTEELGDCGVQLLLGSDFIINKKMILTAGFSEDIKVNTSPDFVFYLGLNYVF